MSDLSVQALVDAGAHIGCRVGRWNPKMEPFILESRNRIHIIDLKQTIRGILRAKHFLREIVASGEDVLFVGTKQQIRGIVSEARERAGMPFVSDRWIGGTLTNFGVIGSRIAHLEEMEKKEAEGIHSTLTKKEGARFNRERAKLFRNLHGIRDMYRLPGALVVVDTRTERKAVREAQRIGIPVIGVIDTDCDPDDSDLHIPANDDAIRSVTMILEHLFEGVKEGKNLRKERGVADPTRPADFGVKAAPVPRPTRGRGKGGPRRGGGGPPGTPRPTGTPGRRVPMAGGVNRPVEIQPHPESESEGNNAEADQSTEATPAPAAPEGGAHAPETPEKKD